MTTLHKILSDAKHVRHATDAGTHMHTKLKHVRIASNDATGNPDIIKKICANPTLTKLFGPDSRTEVPVAGVLNGRFVSRRIDRLLINHADKCICILDYKTDIDKTERHAQYVSQIREYATLLRAIHPDYHTVGYILWTHDFSLEKIIVS